MQSSGFTNEQQQLYFTKLPLLIDFFASCFDCCFCGVDVGCGIGGSTAALADKFNANVLGVDLSSNMISIAKERYSSRPDLKFLVADALSIPIDSESVDLVYSRDTILHLSVDEKKLLFSKAFDWLKPDGQVSQAPITTQSLRYFSRSHRSFLLQPRVL